VDALRRRRVSAYPKIFYLFIQFFSLYHYQSSFAGSENPIAVTVGGTNAHCWPKRNPNDSHISSPAYARGTCAPPPKLPTYIIILYTHTGIYIFTHIHVLRYRRQLTGNGCILCIFGNVRKYIIYAAKRYPGLANSIAC